MPDDGNGSYVIMMAMIEHRDVDSSLAKKELTALLLAMRGKCMHCPSVALMARVASGGESQGSETLELHVHPGALHL